MDDYIAGKVYDLPFEVAQRFVALGWFAAIPNDPGELAMLETGKPKRRGRPPGSRNKPK